MNSPQGRKGTSGSDFVVIRLKPTQTVSRTTMTTCYAKRSEHTVRTCADSGDDVLKPVSGPVLPKRK